MERLLNQRDKVAGLFDQHAARAFRYARAMGLSSADADDVVAETFLRVLESHGSSSGAFRGEAAFSTWLFRVVSNQVLDVARRESRRRARQEAVARRAATAVVGPADRSAEANEMHAAIGEALAGLEAGERAALSLVTAGGLSYRDAAAVEGVSATALASRVLRARRAVRRHLAERGLVPEGPKGPEGPEGPDEVRH